MARRSCSLAPVMWLTAALLGSDAMAQTEPFREPATLRSQFVSPAVIATWGAVGGALGQDRLRYLVLWRGSPGWVWPGPFGARGQMIGGTDERKDPPQSVSQQLFVGKITFGLTVNLRASVVQIEGQEFDLHKSNVFLVDRLDEPDAPRVVRQMWVDPEIPAGDTFEAVIRREPELRAFIRCENVFLDPAQAEVARVLCMRTLDGVVSGR